MDWHGDWLNPLSFSFNYINLSLSVLGIDWISSIILNWFRFIWMSFAFINMSVIIIEIDISLNTIGIGYKCHEVSLKLNKLSLIVSLTLINICELLPNLMYISLGVIETFYGVLNLFLPQVLCNFILFYFMKNFA